MMTIQEMEIENVIVGSGAAGFQTALRLVQFGEKNTAVVTENVKAGTSRNTGSDKQTYYKLSLAANDADSVLSMAEDLMNGHCVDGDIALCEAALSARSFFRLLELGVPFPCTEFGEYMGYKTDHDRGRRATSAGPYTSKIMTECLEREVKREGVKILDRKQAIRIFTLNGRVHALLCLNLDNMKNKDKAFTLIWCKNLILATGGPAGLYKSSVYPVSQLGNSGMAFEAGVKGKNLTEWQYGMASIAPRWNVSGSYMQVLPTFVSTSSNGSDEREFLTDFFNDYPKMLSLIFLKGYQWPFDVEKIWGGSSLIDLLVYQETVMKKRRVFLDFRRNPNNMTIPYDDLMEEAGNYLKAAEVCSGETPYSRLEIMNPSAIQFYRDHNIDLAKERLEIAICAQHNNGGLSANSDWETNINGIFAVGEVCGTHGVTRPGGTALNSGQVGALRAAECIYLRNKKYTAENRGLHDDVKAKIRKEAYCFAEAPEKAEGKISLSDMWMKLTENMSAYGGIIRSEEKLKHELSYTNEILENFSSIIKKTELSAYSLYFRLRDMLITRKMYLFAMLDYLEHGANSRGSALYTADDGKLQDKNLPEQFRCKLDCGTHNNVIQEVFVDSGICKAIWRDVRPIPKTDYFFEKQWKLYRDRYSISK